MRFAAPAPVPVAPQPANGATAALPSSDYAAPPSSGYPAPPNASYPAPPNPNYVVNGLALGAPLGPPADAAAGYACHASDDYPGFAWCQSHHAESRKFGSETTWMSVFRSQTNAAVEITQAVDPAFFRQGDVDRETQRLSRDFGQQARVIAADLPMGGHAVVAAWGAVTLTPLDRQLWMRYAVGRPFTAACSWPPSAICAPPRAWGCRSTDWAAEPVSSGAPTTTVPARACCASPPSIPAR